MNRKKQPILLAILLISLISGCSGPNNTPSEVSVTDTPASTQEPMALIVNGEGITVTEYQAELTRLQQAETDLGISSSAQEQHDKVIVNFTDQLLLAQAAAQAGFIVDDATLQARIDALATKMGGADKLQVWESANGYTDAAFRTALRREIVVAWEKDQICNSVPTTADQVHARQILVQDEGNANSYYQQLQSGTDFAELAYTLDQTTGGDLGWFPQGYLTQPEIETAVFAMQPGQYSSVIKTQLGYHIIYVIERDATHVLSVDARRILQENALTAWLTSARATATIQILI
jgi:peptidyl-prolyl cis-trans isomerase C